MIRHEAGEAAGRSCDQLLSDAAEALQQNRLDEADHLCRCILESDQDHPTATHLAGMIAHRRADLPHAAKLMEKSIQYNGGEASWHYNLGLVYRDANRMKDAENAYRRALAIKPDYAVALYNLGSVLIRRNQRDEAANCFLAVLKLNPDHVQANYRLGGIKYEKGNVPQAIELLSHAVELSPDDPDIRLLLIYSLRDNGRYDEALEHLDVFRRRGSDDENAVAVEASVYERLGRVDQAWQCLRPVIEKGTQNTNILTVYADLSKKIDMQEHALGLIQQLLGQGKVKGEYRTILHFTIGRLLDELEQYDEAFEHFTLANSRMKVVYDPVEQEQKVDAMIRVFSPGSIEKILQAEVRDHRPVFIVGMPRSGTSLIEQILASHPQVTGTGESALISNLASSIPMNLSGNPPYPECLTETPQDHFGAMATIFSQRLDEYTTTSLRVTDKTPLNMMHLGLITRIYPHARIIHACRHPMASCFSCYTMKFVGRHAYSYKLEHLGHFYRQYQRMMDHWHKVLDVPVLDMHYEQLVSDPESNMRKLIAFIGLEWDDACARFHENKRLMVSASYDQVRRPIYTKSIDHWKHYERHLEPLKRALSV